MSTDESKDKDIDNKPTTAESNGKASTETISEYKRQKNIISGIDNGHLALGVAGVALAVAGALAFPHIKEWVGNITNKNQQIPPPPPPIEEQPYIPPTPPLPPTTPEPVQQQPVTEQPPQQEQQQEDEIPDTFYDDELKKRRQLITGRKHLKYDSQFGAGIANS